MFSLFFEKAKIPANAFVFFFPRNLLNTVITYYKNKLERITVQIPCLRQQTRKEKRENFKIPVGVLFREIFH